MIFFSFLAHQSARLHECLSPNPKKMSSCHVMRICTLSPSVFLSPLLPAWSDFLLPHNTGRCALGCPLWCFSCLRWGMFRSQEVPHLLPRGAAPGPELGKAYTGLSSAPDGLALSVPAVKVTLDPCTAHPLLVLSQDNCTVRWESKWQQVPKTPERFDTSCCVLGREEFREGRHCWEVEVEGGKGTCSSLAVGVARVSVKRKGEISMSPEEGIWAVQYSEEQLTSLTSPPTPLSLSPVPTRLWVCLDCTQGQVSFINPENRVKIFTFPDGQHPVDPVPSLGGLLLFSRHSFITSPSSCRSSAGMRGSGARGCPVFLPAC
uniref:B30.2/SPRY domain-containing protein n=1 Tax=Anas platyrhynchos TaxID=8839 RepID=A0A8B9SXJ2_ANAPL